MYELVWEKSGYQVVQSRRRPKDGASARSEHFPLAEWHSTIDREAWKEYVTTGKPGGRPVPEHIQQSWSRCLESGVDPASGKCWDIRQDRELGDESLRLRGLIEDIREDIFSLVRGCGLLLTISDRSGYLLSMCGDHRALLAADRLNFGPGANWSEASVGTNAIGTALACARPMRVSAHEHFCESHHGWICSAAPIFDLQGTAIGCLDISGPTSSDHTHALALAVKGARVIETQLYRSEAAKLDYQYTSLIRTMFNVVTSGLVHVRADGRITAANPTASVLLGADHEQLAGAPVDHWFDIKELSRTLQRPSSSAAAGGVRVACWLGPHLQARAFPILSPNQVLTGILLVIDELQRTCHSKPGRAMPEEDPFLQVLGRSLPMRETLAKARRAAGSPATVLISGESGTGKEVLAKALHRAGPRRKGPFVAVNCGAIPAELIQSVLFGYVEGAFTGARRGGCAGEFESASGGTLLLDEIGEMSLAMQVNLLRVLEERRITRVGGTKSIAVDVRILAATNRDLEQQVREGSFRTDLFYRLNVVRIHLPPLRERGADIQLLATHLIGRLSEQLGRPVRRVANDLFEVLGSYPWPGNVRELRHALESAITLMPENELTVELLPDAVRGGAGPSSGPEISGFNLQQLQEETIRRAFHHYAGNITQMAKALGIGRNTLYAKLKKFEVL